MECCGRQNLLVADHERSRMHRAIRQPASDTTGAISADPEERGASDSETPTNAVHRSVLAVAVPMNNKHYSQVFRRS
jgi:hypothetical protein